MPHTVWYRQSRTWFTLSAFAIVLWIGVTCFCDPSLNVWAPKCTFKMLTGLQCPGCGLQRAMFALLHGHVTEAMGYNWFLIIVTPYLLLLVLGEFWPKGYARTRIQAFTENRHTLFIYLFLYILWGIVRNIFGL
ncbi:MAG: DUF2752 domain-containing protein [Alloprevotella sp.]|nr:DUF2752 domain-containing protein [Alloprevotella sp.]